jgi:SAM-dependent methyltransferase
MVSCPVCAGPATEFLTRSAVPVHQNLLLPSPGLARGVSTGRLAMHVCRACGFAFNAAFDPDLLSYGAQYDNTQTCSPAFAAHVDQVVTELVERHGVRGRRVVEVGCGKGDFLRRLVGPAEYQNTGFGFDPSYVGPDQELGGRLRFIRTLYDERAAELVSDVVVCRHVIEHVPDPVGLLRSVRRAVAGRSAQVFFETPCVEWILRGQVVWDFFYEHCSLFTAGSLRLAFRRTGFEVLSVRTVFGGQYLWLEARPVDRPDDAPDADEPPATPALAEAFSQAERRRVAFWRQELARRAGRGPVAVWGAGAKGVTFCNLVDPEGDRIDCVVDINPAKQGRFIAGTGHPIVGPSELSARGVRSVFVLNPNYVPEITRDLAVRDVPAAVYDLMAVA